MIQSQPVTTYTAMSSDVPGESTYTLWSKVTETLADALAHVDTMGEGREHLTVVGGTADGRMIRYAWHGEPKSILHPDRCHDTVIIVKHQDRDHTGPTQWEINETSLPG